MTDQMTPLYSMSMKTGESLIRDLERQLSAVAVTQAKTKAKFQNWKAVVKQPQDNEASGLVEAGMMGFFLDFLFGMPIFSGVSEAAKGMLDIGLMAHSATGKENSNTMPDMAMLNALIGGQGRKRDQALSGQTMQAANMKKMRTVVMMMVMMMMQDAENTESGGSGEGSMLTGDMMAADVLRHPKLARFKQNRHSLACIREMFQVQAEAVIPKFNAPRCQLG